MKPKIIFSILTCAALAALPYASGSSRSWGGTEFRIPDEFQPLSEKQANEELRTDAFAAGGFVYKSPSGALIYHHPGCVIPIPTTKEERRKGLLKLLADPWMYKWPFHEIEERKLLPEANRDWVWIKGKTFFDGNVSIFVHAETVTKNATFDLHGIAPISAADELTSAIESFLDTFKENSIEPDASGQRR
jgi:hypothetical protein